MRVLVCGGRDFRDTRLLSTTLHRFSKGLARPEVLIHGNAPGADRLAAQWAACHGIRVQAFPANWVADGKAAGPIRNSRMIAEGKPDLVVAFPGGRGTADLVKKARAAGIEVIEVTG